MDCLEGFDGGSTVEYMLQFSAGTIYHTVVTSKSTHVRVKDQQPGTSYTMRLCATNEEYPAQQSCSSQLRATTKGEMSHCTIV